MAGLPLAGCVGRGAGGGDPGNVDGTLVEMTGGNRFEPETVAVPAGETVVWRNAGYAPHTVTAYEDGVPAGATYFASGGFTSESAARSGASAGDGVVEDGSAYEHTFDVPGTYAYFCVPHEHAGMTGEISVEEASGGISVEAPSESQPGGV